MHLIQKIPFRVFFVIPAEAGIQSFVLFQKSTQKLASEIKIKVQLKIFLRNDPSPA